MGFEDEAEQSKWRPYRQCNGRSKRTYELTSSIVPRGTSFHGLVELEIPPIVFVYLRPHATTASRVQRNSVPSTHMRCMITANRRARATVAFSNRPVGVKRFQAISHYLSDDPLLQCRCRSRARASLRNRHQGPSIMGFEDEAEQSVGRPCRQSDSRFKRHYELTSSIVPRGTSFHGLVELEFSPIVFDPARFSCCCRGLFPGPAELSAINPYAVHDHGQPTRQRHDRLFHSAAPGDLHRPGLEPGPSL